MPNPEPDSQSSRRLAGPDPLPEGALGGPPTEEIAKKVRTKPPAVHYLGFRITPDGREYLMRVADELAPRVFVLLVTHEAFATRQMRFQDAPDLCSRKLERELLADPELLAARRLLLTAEDLLDYRHAHAPSAVGRQRRA